MKLPQFNPLRRPFKMPYEPAFIIERDGEYVFLPHKATRMCLPAYVPAINKLKSWQQSSLYSYIGAKQVGNPWLEYYQGMGACIINDGNEVKIASKNYLYRTTIKGYGLGLNAYDVRFDGGGWSHDTTNHKFSFEFFLDNDLEETSPDVMYDDDESFWSDYEAGSTGSCALTSQGEDTSEQIKGTSCEKVVVGSGTSNYVGVFHDYGSGGNELDVSDKDFLCLYIYGANAGGTVTIYMQSAAVTHHDYTISASENWSGWKRFVIPLKAFTNPGDLTDINKIYVRWTTPGTRYVDRIVTDVGQWVKVETFVPDVLLDNTNSVRLSAWDGATYDTLFYGFNGVDASEESFFNGSRLHFLDGTTMNDVLGNIYQGYAGYTMGERGDVKTANRDSNAGNITYSSYYGCKNRIGFAIKMPPDNGQDSSTTGISQCKLKLEVYYDGNTEVKDTSGFNTNGIRYGCLDEVCDYGKCLHLNGSSDWIDFGFSEATEITDEISIELLVKFDDISGYQYILQKQGTGGGENNGFFIRLYNDSKIHAFFRCGLLGDVDVVSSGTVSIDTWYHVIATYDSVNGGKLYIDTVNVGNTASVGVLNPTVDGHLVIGQNYNNDQYHIDASVARCRIFNKVLDSDDRTLLFNGGRVTDELKAEYLFNDDIQWGKTTYEFENGTNSYYGLQNINDSWIAFFNPTANRVEYLIFSKQPTGLELTADEDELITQCAFTLDKGTKVLIGEMHHADLTRDSDGDGVPDFLSGGKPTAETSEVIEIYDDDEGFWSEWTYGVGSYGITLSEETTEVMTGESALKMVIGAGTDEWLGVQHDYGSAQDWSTKKYLAIRLFGTNSGDTYKLAISSDESNIESRWVFLDNWSGWKTLFYVLDDPTEVVGGGADFSNINHVRLYSQPSGARTNYLDRFVVDNESPIGLPHIVSKRNFKGWS